MATFNLDTPVSDKELEEADRLDWMVMSGRDPYGIHVEDNPEDWED